MSVDKEGPAERAGEADPEGEPEVLEGLARDIVSRLATTLFGDDDVPLWQRDNAGGRSPAGLGGVPRAAGTPGGVASAGAVTASGPAVAVGPETPGATIAGPDGAVEAGAGEARAVPVTQPGLWVRPLRPREPASGRPALLVRGTIRSGRQIRHNGDVVVLGDVNPGGQVVSSGDVVVMGTLRGMVHAGATGDYGAVVAAFRLCPTQLRIASYVARPPEEPGGHPEYPELALVKDGVVVVVPMTTATLTRSGPDEGPSEQGGWRASLIGKQ